MADQVMAFYHLFQSAAGANGNGTAMDVGGLSAVGVQVEGIVTATVNFEATIDGNTWYAVRAVSMTSGTQATTTTADGLFLVPVLGADKLRCRISGWGEGAITVTGKGVTNAPMGSAGDVDIAAISAGENHIGAVGGHTVVVAQTPTITAGAYHAKDAVGGLLTFANAARVSGGSGVIHTVTVIDDDAEAAELVLTLFNQTFTPTADNAAFAPSDADMENCIGKITIAASDYQAFSTNSVAQVTNVGRAFKLTGTSLFGQLMCTGTPTYTATGDLTIKVHILQD